MAKLVLITVLVSWLKVLPLSCHAAIVEVQIGGYVERADAVGDTGIQVGDRFTGVFRYDLDMPLRASISGQSRYAAPWTESYPAFEVTIRGATFALELDTDTSLRLVNDQDLSFPEDSNSPENVDLFYYSAANDKLHGSIGLAGLDLNGLSHTMIPQRFTLSDWESAYFTLIAPNMPFVLADGTYVPAASELLIEGAIDQMMIVPEPVTIVLCSVALTGLCLLTIARRRARRN